MKSALLAGALGLILLSSAALAQDPVYASPAGGVSSPIDRQFTALASASNSFEVQSSKLALQKSRTPAVRDLARLMVQGHSQAEARLRDAATYADYQGGAETVATPTTSATLSDLAGLDGDAFDKAYVDAQVASHRLAADRLSDYAVQGSYEPLLRYDAATLPEVKGHLARWQALQARMSGGTSDGM